MNMFIQTEETPNPNALKFLPGVPVYPEGIIEFLSSEDASHSPLAKALFKIKGIKSMLFGIDFITINKEETQEWNILKAEILGTIMEHFTARMPVMGGAHATTPSPILNEDDSEIVKEIKEIIETRVRPSVAQDGGDITFYNFEDGIVYVELKGACSGCPSSSITLKSGIERLLQHYVPEVKEIKAINE